MLNLEGLLRVPQVDPTGSVSISPCGRLVAFSWNPSGRWEIYTVPMDGTAAPRQVTGGPGAKFAPRWSSDGHRLAFVVDLDGGELYDIHCHTLSTDRCVNLTPDTPDAIQPNFCWSPDGRWIAFASDRSGVFDTYVMPSSGGPARPVLSLPYPDWQVQWSPDGRWLAVVAETSGQDYGTFLVPMEGGEAGEASAVALEGEPICAKDACWSPDSRSLAFASDLHGQFDVGIYDLENRAVAWVTGGQGDKELPVWSPDGRRLAYVVSQGPASAIALHELGSGRATGFQVEAGVHDRPSFTPDGEHLLFLFDNPRHPCDLWLLTLAEWSARRLTDSLPAEFGDAGFVLPEQVLYPGLDGQEVPALLYLPAGVEKPLPAVVMVHGGPNWLSRVTWDPVVQHMVSRGWAVLAPNYRGSTGYGREWQLASRFDYGGVDNDDVVAGADYLVREGIADPARIALTGRSWGGYLTMTGLTQYPDRWAAGSAVVPFLNWFTGHANSRKDLQHWDLENFGDPERDRDLYYERSPYFFLERVAAPVQLICGAHDPRCPASESTQAQDRLVAAGKSCDLVLYPDEGHSFLKIENVVDAERRRMAFLAKALER
jgi:dipeptidyl aminopeptidase/acylaminoacyl peptidase